MGKGEAGKPSRLRAWLCRRATATGRVLDGMFRETEDQRKRRVVKWWRPGAYVVGAVLGLAVLLAVLVVLPGALTFDPTDEAKRTLILQLAAGFVVLLGIANTARQIREVSRQNDLNRIAQVNERFGRAVQQLGDEREFVRVGGVYALEAVSRDAEELWVPVMETLTAYVRDQGHKVASIPRPDDEERLITTDIQAMLTVIGRSERPEGWCFDLREAALGRAILRGADLHGADLDEAHLYGAALMGTNLAGARLFSADLAEVNLTMANLTGAALIQADLRSANLSGADLSRARLWSALLSGACLRQADLSGAKLDEADLRGANLTEANLSGADLAWADLQDTAVTHEQLATALNVDKAHNVDKVRAPKGAPTSAQGEPLDPPTTEPPKQEA